MRNKTMRNLFIVVYVVVVFPMVVFSQDTANDNTTGQNVNNVDTGRQLLREIVIDTFDDPTRWEAEMAIDRGVITSRRQFGGSKEKTPVRTEEQINGFNPTDNYIYGIRVDYFSRNNTNIYLRAVRPIYVPGIVKNISVWVAGRGKDHNLIVVLQDMKGNLKRFPLGKLNYRGWKKLEINIPVEVDQEGVQGVVNGLYIKGFIIDTNFVDTVGRYYVYFDDIRAISDVIDEVYSAGGDDPSDGW